MKVKQKSIMQTWAYKYNKRPDEDSTSKKKEKEKEIAYVVRDSHKGKR